MKEPDERTSLETTAYHEAGHAVAYYLLRKRFKHVTIKTQEKKLGDPTCSQKISKSIPSERELKAIRREYIVFLAGPVAEAILSGRCEFEDVLFILFRSNSTEDNNSKLNKVFWKFLFVETKLLIYAPWNWQAVMVLTDELLKQYTIRYQTAREIIGQAIEDYHAGVRNGISALHHARYSDFVKEVADAKIRFRQSIAPGKP